VPVAVWLGQTAIERTLLIGSAIAVVIVEFLNSAVEAVEKLQFERIKRYEKN
jgi:diacylglycerol kinase (ATP)